MAFADYTSQGAVAVITLKNPPVNALSLGLRTAIVDGLERAAGDGSIRAVVIVGSGTAFCGGADVGEFGLPAMFAEPVPGGFVCADRELAQTGDRGDQRTRVGRGTGTRHGVPLPRRRRVGAARNARGQAGYSAGRGRYAAAAAPGRRRTGAEHDRERQSRERARFGGDRFARFDRRWRCAARAPSPLPSASSPRNCR